MVKFKRFLESACHKTIPILDSAIALQDYMPIDLSTSYTALENLDMADPDVCETYVNGVLEPNKAKVAYGGYLEKRGIYSGKKAFINPWNIPRDIHLGLDFWAKAGTKILAPLEGTVHSFKNNAAAGDYGPTIILLHRWQGFEFHTLYGHLSMSSLRNLHPGKTFAAGEVLATLGHRKINGNYAPHLHFQLIIDMHGQCGDYPGVCVADELAWFSSNCPDPDLLLKM